MENNKLWFRRKRFGWGWYPVTWQGWVVVLGFAAFLVYSSLGLPKVPTDGMITSFSIKVVLSVVVLIIICYKKGEKPKWQWDGK